MSEDRCSCCFPKKIIFWNVDVALYGLQKSLNRRCANTRAAAASLDRFAFDQERT